MHQGDKIATIEGLAQNGQLSPSSKRSSITMDSSAAIALPARSCPPRRSSTSPSAKRTTRSAPP
jgi:hypothetical protein